MKFNEALYFAFVIGHRGKVSRNNWKLYPEYKYQSINLTCHPSDEDDYKDYLHISNKPFCYTVLDDKLKNNIQPTTINQQTIISEDAYRILLWTISSINLNIGRKFSKSTSANSPIPRDMYNAKLFFDNAIFSPELILITLSSIILGYVLFNSCL